MHFGSLKSRRGTVYRCITMYALMFEISEKNNQRKGFIFDNPTVIWRPLSRDPREYSHKPYRLTLSETGLIRLHFRH